MSEEFIIRELSGTQREVRLRAGRSNGGALPLQGVEFGGEQAHAITWYPGNAKATVQILGPREEPLQVQGSWRDSKLVGAVALVGFDDILPPGQNITAEGLVEVFRRIRIAGNELEVRWGPEVRRGLLSKFTPSYIRLQDIDWSAEFVWTQSGDFVPVATSRPPESTVVTMTKGSNAMSNAAAGQPKGLVDQPASLVQQRVSDMRTAVQGMRSAIVTANTQAEIVSSRVQQVQTAAQNVISAGRSVRKGTLDLPYTEMLPNDDVVEVLRVETWRREIGAQSRRTQADAVRNRDQIMTRAVPGHIAIITVRENVSLRSLAAQYYGNADSWTVIADANGIVGSYVVAGTVVTIPRAPATAVAAR